MVINEAKAFITQFYKEQCFSEQLMKARIKDVEREIEETGTYTHTSEELEYGARVAWRNSNRCIGRLFWDKLKVIDNRHIESEAAFIEAIEHHIESATNDGMIIPTITIFADANKQRINLYNDQLIRYSDDPIVRETKALIEHTGYTNFGKFLPLLYSIDGTFKTYEINPDIIKEVTITHPEHEAFNQLNLAWYAVPIISSMDLKIGGITYPLVPFNGWYMESEIASRNFLDDYRYDKMKEIAEAFGFDTTTTTSYWRDRTVVEMNYAVYHSFKQHGVSIVDHYTASRQFARFEQNEADEGRSVTGDWTWLIPPISPSIVHNFHKGYKNIYNNPNFYYKKKVGKCPFST